MVEERVDAEKIQISIVVCTYNRSQLLRLCLESLINQSLDKEQYEIIVVNNNCSDGTSRVLKEFMARYPNILMVEERKQGISYARNRGYKEARGEFVAYIDDDARADGDWVRRILDAFKAVTPSPSAVGGKALAFCLEKKPEWFLDEYETRSWGEQAGFLNGKRAAYGFYGTNMAFPRKILVDHGGFPVDLGMQGEKMGFGEETALFNRLVCDNPYFWYDPEIKVEHLIQQYKMKVRYRLKRQFLGGVYDVRARDLEASPSAIVKFTILAVLRGVILLLRTKWWRDQWRSNFMKYAKPFMETSGRSYELIVSYLRAG